jgi:penicillin-binding protein 1A
VPAPVVPAPPYTAAPAPSRARRWGWRLLRWAIIGGIWGALALAVALLWFARDLPRPETALDAIRRPSLTLEDRSGRIIATYGDLVGETLRLTDLPPALPAAVVAVEDRRFWHHPGIDPIGLARAVWVNLRAGHVVQGGSTITQQVAKTLFLSNARTMQRKVQELLLTFWLERHFTKREILEIYLNRVYLGAGAWGMDAGARMFFGVSARRVNLWQAAILAGLPRAPSRFNPRTNASAAIARGKEVLAAMADSGVITETQAQGAAAQIVIPLSPTMQGWFADYVAGETEQVLQPGKDAILRTTLDSRIQSVAETRLAGLLNGPGAAADVSQGAVIVLDAATGAIRAMVGGRDYHDSPYNRAVLARRQPGSAFKVFTWLAALEKGKRPDDTVLDAPIRIGHWAPTNFEHRYLGEITLEEALAQSVNTVAVRLLLESGGPRAVAAVAARMGIAGKLPNDASLALGTGEVGLMELTAAYAPFCNGGRRVAPFGLDQAAHPPEPVIDPAVASMMARMLGAVVSRGTGRPAAVPGRAIIGKTGTTQDFKDAWFIGCDGGELIGVWLGNDDNQPMKGVLGGGLPARLFHDIAVAVR